MRGVAYRDGGRERERERRRLSTRDTARDTACREVRASGSTAREIETKRGERPEQPCTLQIYAAGRAFFENAVFSYFFWLLSLTLSSHDVARRQAQPEPQAHMYMLPDPGLRGSACSV